MSAIIKNITNIVIIPKSSARNSKDMVWPRKAPGPLVPLKKETNYHSVNGAWCSQFAQAQVSPFPSISFSDCLYFRLSMDFSCGGSWLSSSWFRFSFLIIFSSTDRISLREQLLVSRPPRPFHCLLCLFDYLSGLDCLHPPHSSPVKLFR